MSSVHLNPLYLQGVERFRYARLFLGRFLTRSHSNSALTVGWYIRWYIRNTPAVGTGER